MCDFKDTFLISVQVQYEFRMTHNTQCIPNVELSIGRTPLGKFIHFTFVYMNKVCSSRLQLSIDEQYIFETCFLVNQGSRQLPTAHIRQ